MRLVTDIGDLSHINSMLFTAQFLKQVKGEVCNTRPSHTNAFAFYVDLDVDGEEFTISFEDSDDGLTAVIEITDYTGEQLEQSAKLMKQVEECALWARRINTP